MATTNTVEVEEEVEAEMEEEEMEAEEEATPTRAFPCPTCGMLFSESAVCDTHASFCAQSDEPGADWSDERILLLIDCMSARYSKYVQMSGRERKHHWKRTAHIVGATADDARHRWNHLTSSYNRIRIAKSQGRMRASDRWRFYEKIDNILGDKTTSRAEFVLSSMPLDNTSDDGLVQPHTGMVLSPDGDAEVGSTSKLVDYMEERYDIYIKMSPKKRKQFWREMAQELNIPSEEARIRWNMVVGSFKRTKMNRAAQMKRYGREPKHKWRYYDQMERIVGNRYNSVIPLMLLSTRQMPPASGFSLATGANLFTASKPLPDLAPAPPRPPPSAAGGTALRQPPPPTVYQLGPNGVLQAVPSASVPPAAAATVQAAAAASVQATVLQAGTPQQQQADIETFATKRKALFVEDYLRAKARREEQRLQLEERRIRALERLVDVMEARGNC